MEFDRAFLSTKFKASGLRDIKFNDNELHGTEFNSAHGVKFKTNEPRGAEFGMQGLAAECKILAAHGILAVRGILKFKDASAR
ncbi:hypothetical protein [uncultured Campylobacter sp.]|uniref:hypothetical protein n=1 Tax=uncultured Campylobacter sp. TaxID=218934 RepID=UPI00261CB91A|nr:hypothetical protein [uncultured Campylobacter sp.]